MARRRKKYRLVLVRKKYRSIRTRRRRLRLLSALLIIVVASLVVLAVVLFDTDRGSTSKPEPSPRTNTITSQFQFPALAYHNAVDRRAVSELRRYGEWLRENNAQGFIGEMGWPDRPGDGPQWNAVADSWYREAAYHDIWVTVWAAGSWWGDYPMAAYIQQAGRRGLDAARAQAAVIENYPTKDNKLRGVNLTGMEFGTEASGFSNANPGTAGHHYFYEPAWSISYLAGRGVKLIRLPIRWERIQPVLGGNLKNSEVQAIRSILDAAASHDMQVVLDLHNYGVYKDRTGELLLGASLPHNHLVDVWQRLSVIFKNHAGLAAYGLMNEPHDLPASAYGTPAKNWEAASQQVVTALRDNGDKTLVMVAGYDWSSTARWPENHPKGWIHDPANNFRYEAHHYWDFDGSGQYINSFDKELGSQ